MRTKLTGRARRIAVLTMAGLAVLAGTGRGQGPGAEPQLPRQGGTPLPAASSVFTMGPGILVDPRKTRNVAGEDES